MSEQKKVDLKNVINTAGKYLQMEVKSPALGLRFTTSLKVFFSCEFRDCYILHKQNSSLLEVFYEKAVLKNFAKFIGKHLCHSLFFNKVEACNFIKKETLAKVFCCGFCEIFKNIFFYRTPLVAASAKSIIHHDKSFKNKMKKLVAHGLVYFNII